MKRNIRLLALATLIGSFAFATGCNPNNNGKKMDSGYGSQPKQKDQMQDMQKKHSDSMYDSDDKSSDSSDMYHGGGCGN